MRHPDMSRAQFRAALERNGFTGPTLFWFQDKTGATPGYSFSGLFLKNGKIARRATIAHLIRQRAEAIRTEATRKTARD